MSANGWPLLGWGNFFANRQLELLTRAVAELSGLAEGLGAEYASPTTSGGMKGIEARQLIAAMFASEQEEFVLQILPELLQGLGEAG